MELQIAKRYPVAATLEQAWAVLSDPQQVAACMPGATLTESLDAQRHKGQVKTRIGPASLAFAGEIDWQESDAAARRIRLHARGADKGGSAAQMQLQAHLEASGAGCELVGQATVSVSGKLAQFGNRLLQPASDALLAQFAQAFSAAAAAVPLPAASQDQALPGAADADAGAGVDAIAPPRAATPAAAPAARELKLLSLLGHMLRAWWAGLFRKP